MMQAVLDKLLTMEDIERMRHQGCSEREFVQLLAITEAAIVVTDEWQPFWMTLAPW